MFLKDKTSKYAKSKVADWGSYQTLPVNTMRTNKAKMCNNRSFSPTKRFARPKSPVYKK